MRLERGGRLVRRLYVPTLGESNLFFLSLGFVITAVLRNAALLFLIGLCVTAGLLSVATTPPLCSGSSRPKWSLSLSKGMKNGICLKSVEKFRLSTELARIAGELDLLFGALACKEGSGVRLFIAVIKHEEGWESGSTQEGRTSSG